MEIASEVRDLAGFVSGLEQCERPAIRPRRSANWTGRRFLRWNVAAKIWSITKLTPKVCYLDNVVSTDCR